MVALEQRCRCQSCDVSEDDKWARCDARTRCRFTSDTSTACSEGTLAGDGTESFPCREDCSPSWVALDLSEVETSAPSDEDKDSVSREVSKASGADDFSHASTDAPPEGSFLRFKELHTTSDSRPLFAKQRKELVVRACTWNLFGRQVSEHDELEQWLVQGGQADILVVGVQELVELRPKTAVRDCFGNRARLSELEERIESVIRGKSGARYQRLCSIGMVGLALTVYLREELSASASRPECFRIRTGFGGAVGNKGAVCARVKVDGFSACFVNVHLPSGEGRAKAQKRDRHLSKVLARAAQGCSGGVEEWVPVPCRDPAAGNSSSDLLSRQHGLVVVLGDFNSRRCVQAERALFEGVPAAGLTCESPARHDGRLCDDELLNSMFGSSLTGFHEGAIQFAPTFGYVPGTDLYEPRRRPAWTDRVVYKASHGARVVLDVYDAFQELRHTSDHRPVAAQLRVSF